MTNVFCKQNRDGSSIMIYSWSSMFPIISYPFKIKKAYIEANPILLFPSIKGWFLTKTKLRTAAFETISG
jgi:hypothetical protein